VLIDDGAQYKLGAPVARRRGMTLGSQCDESVASGADGIDAAAWENGALAIDEFNYCANAPDLDHCAAVDDLELDPGLPLVSLLNRAEGIPAAARRKTSGKEPDGLPALAASELFESLGNPANKYLSATLEDQALVIQSTLEPEQHAYAYLAGHYTPRQLHCTDIARMQLVADRGDGLSLVLVFFDASGQKISHALVKSAANVTVAVPAGTHSVQVGIRVAGPGAFRISRLALEHVPLAVDMVVTRGRHLLIAKNYPSYDDLYKHAFVHRRAVEYARRLGVAVDVFRIGTEGLHFYEFDGIDVIHGQADHLRAILRSGSHESLLVHVLDERTWDVLQEFSDRYRVYIWAHGSEIQSASRRECDHVDEATRTRAIALGDRRMAFWRNIFREAHPNLEFVFVSAWSAADAMADIGVELPPESYRVIHNFIDTELFAYQPKPAAQRTRILSIRPFSSNVYANDLSVAAILQLSTRPFFDELEIRIVGDGPLFEATVAPLRQFPNVIIEQTFLTQVQIAALHRDYGVFLVPSRMDSQGVSRDEAMSSGLVPVTNRVAAIPEFVDDACGLLVEPDDASGLAAAIERIYHDPALFEQLSAAAAARVRAQCGYEATIAREIALFDTAPGR
jgi:glycosyltransferase involved in cell wall biosynthesis